MNFDNNKAVIDKYFIKDVILSAIVNQFNPKYSSVCVDVEDMRDRFFIHTILPLASKYGVAFNYEIPYKAIHKKKAVNLREILQDYYRAMQESIEVTEEIDEQVDIDMEDDE